MIPNITGIHVLTIGFVSIIQVKPVSHSNHGWVRVVLHLFVVQALPQNARTCGGVVHGGGGNYPHKQDVSYQQAQHHPLILPHFAEQKTHHRLITI